MYSVPTINFMVFFCIFIDCSVRQRVCCLNNQIVLASGQTVNFLKSNALFEKQKSKSKIVTLITERNSASESQMSQSLERERKQVESKSHQSD